MGLVPKEIDTKVYTITNHPHVFIAAFDHPLTGLKKVQPEALNDFDFISREKGSGTRVHMETFIQDHDIQPNIIMEMSSNESIKQAVIAGLGISFVSQHTIASELKNNQLQVLEVMGTPIIRKWHVVTLNPLSIIRPVELLKDFILNQSEIII
jgi:DNA-binding transcriptional LysR family regulator